MEEVMVPIDCGMEFIWHCDSKSYKKYSKQKDALASAIAIQLCKTENAYGNAILYLDAMKMETNHQKALQVTK